jgi:hypothetical protein
MSIIYPQLISKFGPKTRALITEPEERGGFLRGFFFDVLMVKGCHINLIGNPGSGKTQKQYWLAGMLSKIETIAWIDSCKDEEIVPLFSLGLPVQIMIPRGCEIEIKGCDCPQGIMIIEIPSPEAVWGALRKGWVNIISFENYFISPKIKSKWYARLFKHLSFVAFHKVLKKQLGIDRLTIFIDEAQKIAPSTAYTRDQDRIEASMEVAANILENRGNGIRVVTATQENSNILPSARKNMPARILCRGARVKSDESKKLSYLCGFAEGYEPSQGLFVLPNMRYFPRTCPWTFPEFKKPAGASVDYIGMYADIPVDDEGLPDNMGLYHDQMVASKKKPIDTGPSRWDALMINEET